jgi:Flp pilus assembly protein TadG
MRFSPRRSGDNRGQALVIFAVSLVALIGMVGLVIDGGNAWAQQRMTQNSADGAAEAGSVILAQYYAGATAPSTGYAGPCPTSTANVWDLAVCKAVYGAGLANNVTVETADYTNFDGSTILGAVGGGALPAGAQGIRAKTDKRFGTYMIRVVGIDQLGAGSAATAIIGTVSTFCPPDQVCGMLPVTFPVQTSTCHTNGTLQVGTNPWPITSTFDASTESIVPLCKNGPGSVGWLQWPCEAKNGTPGLTEEILSPCIRNLDLPTWVPTYTGNTNAPAVEDAINTYRNKLIWLPQFDDSRGNGAGLEYHVVQLHAFFLDEAFTHGNNHPECNSAPGAPFVGGNGDNGCIKGWWTEGILTGSVHIGPVVVGTTEPLGVQLIK